MEIAYVERPHLTKTLRIWRFRDGAMTHVADHAGLTNHKIGWDFIPGGIRHCGDSPEIMTASHDWQRVMATQYRRGEVLRVGIGVYRGSASLDASRACP